MSYGKEIVPRGEIGLKESSLLLNFWAKQAVEERKEERGHYESPKSPTTGKIFQKVS